MARGEKVLLAAKKANADRSVCLVELSPFLDPLLALFTFSFAERVGEGRRGELIFSGGLFIPFYYTHCVPPRSFWVFQSPRSSLGSFHSPPQKVGRSLLFSPCFLACILWERKHAENIPRLAEEKRRIFFVLIKVTR